MSNKLYQHMSDKLCSCCGNSQGCDCHTMQSPQFRRIAELEAEVERLNRHAEEDHAADADVRELVRKYKEDAERLVAERDRAQAKLNQVDDVLVVNWVEVKDNDYRKALHELIQFNVLIENDPTVSPTAKARQEELERLRVELVEEQTALEREKKAVDHLSQSCTHLLARAEVAEATLTKERDKALAELVEERARLDDAKRILCNLIRVNGGSPLDEEAALEAINTARKQSPCKNMLTK